ncbi:DUF6204 family protein [Streptomyces sp. KLOTTS4A1]|uniref:DUF6204 family protein n=1 Tax=Streptomyces sp. KLOTTS4A1 TaxID=3390996 RepID=UPI0039F46683
MTVRTYRAQVTGRFDGLEQPLRTQLLAEQPEHDLQLAAFTEDGTFTYTPTLTRFTFRCRIGVDADSAVEADELAAVEAEVMTIDYLTSRTIPFRQLRTTTTCLDDVRIKRPQPQRRRGQHHVHEE